MRDLIERELLPYVSKPSRYIGSEVNVLVKPSSQVKLRIALVFPDTYEVGMSHLGLSILYHILNRIEGIQAERVFAPWVDAEERMRRKGIPLFSLETFTPLREFDLIGFSLQYELCYTNLINMLDLAGIPILSSERDDSYPPVIAGGPCAFNPEPLADFVDAFVIGDGEKAIVEIADVLRRSSNKSQFLREISDLEGIYVPALYDPSRGKIRKRLLSSIEGAPHPIRPIVPYMEIIHDRFPVEVMRGCVNGCRFCQAGIIYRPVRERSVERICEILREGISRTGFEDVSLLSLSTCDYSDVRELVRRCIQIAEPEKVSISLPSSRIDSFSIDLARMVQRIRKTGLTFAPEAGTQRLRDVINKPITDEEILKIAEEVYSAGWNLMKLYFMVGLPTETEEDVRQIARLANRIIRIGRRSNKRAGLNVSVSAFVPKPHTPFQWERQISIEEIRRKHEILKGEFRDRRIRFKWTQPEVSFLEGVFARGDRRLGKALIEAHRLGCKFDGWGDQLRFDLWLEAFRRAGITPDEYLRARSLDEPLPWDHIDPLVAREFLISERERAYRGERTPSCRVAGCMGCGLMKYAREACLAAMIEQGRITKHEPIPPPSKSPSPAQRIRLRFHKSGILRYLAHMEVMETFIRALHRARLPIAFSRGFNPRPRIRFAHPAGVGVESMAEIAEMDLIERMRPDEVMEKLNRELPEGLRVEEVFEVPMEHPAPMNQRWVSTYEIRVPREALSLQGCEDQIAKLLSRSEIPVQSSKGRLKDIRPLIVDIRCQADGEDCRIIMDLMETPSGRARAEDLLREILPEAEEIGRIRILKLKSTPD
jgi:radical SAM family uncharacterized protein/radical SAM-linked protein